METKVVEDNVIVQDDISQSYEKLDNFAKKDGVGRELYFDCYVPEGYSMSSSGVWKKEKKWNKHLQEYEDVFRNISSIRIMVTGRFKSAEGNHIVELTYIDKSEMRSICAPMCAILGTREFKETLRPKNIRIDDQDLKDMIKFFNKCIDENENEGGSKFKTGWCFSTTGWKDDNYTQFVAGRRLFEDHSGLLEESKCMYSDEDVAETFNPRGSIQDWVKAVNPLMQYERVRFVCYAGFASVILKFLNVDSFTIDLYGGVRGGKNDKSSSGKTTMTVIAVSGFGNVEPGNAGSLFNTCSSTPNFIENLSVKYTDLPILLDESTKLPKDIREELAYRISAPTTKGRAKDGNGGIQRTRRKQNVVLVTGENPLIPREANIGTKVRAPQIQGGIGVSGIGSLVRDAQLGCMSNSGHLLKPFLTEFFRCRKYVKGWYVRSREQLEDSTENDLSKRQANYFAAIETAGALLELVFEKNGIEKKNPHDVVKNVWNESICSNEIESHWMNALNDVWEWVCVYSERNFGDSAAIMEREGYEYEKKNTNEIWGWQGQAKGSEVINIIPLKLREFLAKNGYDYESTLESWRMNGLINTSNAKFKKDGTLGKQPNDTSASRKGKKYRVVQLREKAVREVLGIDTDGTW